MASPQLERGHTRIADELFEAMIRFDFSKRQYKVLLAVIRKTYGYQKKADVISSGQLAALTGLHSPHCRTAVKELADLGVLGVEKVGQYQRIELIKDYEQWGSKPPGMVEMPGAPGAASGEPPGKVEMPGAPGAASGEPPGMVEMPGAPGAASGEPPGKVEMPGAPGAASGEPPGMVEMPGAAGAASSEAVPKQYRSEPPVPKQSCTETVREPVPKQYGKPYQNGTHKKEETEKQIKPPPQQTPESRGGGGGDLIFPKALSRREADSARQQLGALPPDQRQSVLDVLAAMIGAGEIRKSPLAALGGLIRRYQAGTFDPSPGLHLTEQRERAARHKAARQRREIEISGPPPSTEEVNQARDRLRKFIKPRLAHG